MKLTKKCPEYGGTEIYTRQVGASGGYGSELLPAVKTQTFFTFSMPHF